MMRGKMSVDVGSCTGTPIFSNVSVHVLILVMMYLVPLQCPSFWLKLVAKMMFLHMGFPCGISENSIPN